MYERFTDRSRKVMQLAKHEAQRSGHQYVGTEHLLLGMIKEGSGVAANVLQKLNADLTRVRTEIDAMVQHKPPIVEDVSSINVPQTASVRLAISHAMAAAEARRHNYIGTEHLLIGLAQVKDGVAQAVFQKIGIADRIIEEVDHILGFFEPPRRQKISQLSADYQRALDRNDADACGRIGSQIKMLEHQAEIKDTETMRLITGVVLEHFNHKNGNSCDALRKITGILDERGVD